MVFEVLLNRDMAAVVVGVRRAHARTDHCARVRGLLQWYARKLESEVVPRWVPEECIGKSVPVTADIGNRTMSIMMHGPLIGRKRDPAIA